LRLYLPTDDMLQLLYSKNSYIGETGYILYDNTRSSMIKKRFRITTNLALVLVLIALTVSGAKAQTIRIMPLGNSITAGNMCINGDIDSCVLLGGNNAVGYRLRLFNLLTSAGYDIDFIGSELYGNSLMTDADCAGFGGIRDSKLADIMETGSSTHTGYVTAGPYMDYFPADIVLLHIGTNDVLAADTAEADVDRILDAIDDFEMANDTTVMVFLARIISTRGDPCGTNPWVIAYNEIIDDLAASRQAAGDSLILVDMECDAGLDYENDFMDQVHPNQNGYDRMGDVWFEAIDSWFRSMMITYDLTMEPPIGEGTTSPAEGVHTYADGTEVNVTATPATGYDFTGWTGDLVSTANPETVIMDGDISITATFTKLIYELTVTTDGTAGAMVSPAGIISVEHGNSTVIEVTKVPSGSEFDGWEIVTGSSVTIADPSAQSTTVQLESGNATVRANFKKIIKVMGISIPDNPGKIGDIVTSTITVGNDQGGMLALVSGEIGGFTLSNLVRLNPTTYSADILIEEGGNDYLAEEDIPVSNLVLTDGSLLSEPFNQLIVQNNDPIDANAPKVISLTVPNSVFGVEDTIQMTVIADGEGYRAEPGTEINRVPLQSPRVELSEIAGGEYLLSYTVESSDSSVMPGMLEATVILMDEAGNISNQFKEIEDNSLEIITSIAAVSEAETSYLNIFPNPAATFFFINPGNNTKTAGRIKVIEMSGRCVISKDVSTGHQDFHVDITHLDRGIYIVHWINEYGKIGIGKLIKTE